MSKLQKWELLEEKDISPSKWFPLYQHKIKLPSGLVVDDYFVANLGNVVMILPVTPQNKIIVIEEYKHAVDDFVWLFPAGRVSTGDEALEAAKMELKQETGYEAKAWQFLGKTYPAPSKNKTTIHHFLATDCHLVGRQELEKTEAIEVHKVTWSECEQMVEQNKFNDSNALATMLLFEKKYPQLVKKLRSAE
ncbi:MAG: NUDIX hydrolase [Patescibacteria group bacterium]|nr:NUDIX hydrolase [Patescibacteria group bacterium]